MESILNIKNVKKSFDGVSVVTNLSMDLKKGDIGCFLGPSGCGKTTILRMIAGFEKPDGGSINISGIQVSNGSVHIPPEKRRIGMVFQDYALFPHLNVFDNIAFGLGKFTSSEKRERVNELLELVGLSDSGKKFPHEISGGQQQRVALARALGPKPELLLMDEPFSSLDVTLRERLSVEVRDIIKATGTSALIVTHNQSEAFSIADSIGVMHSGNMEQWDSAYNLYHRPTSTAVAAFVGEGVLLKGSVISDKSVETELGILTGKFTYPCKDGCPAEVLIRPEDVVFDSASELKGEVIEKHFRGAGIMYKLRLPSGSFVLSLLESHHNFSIGNIIGIKPQVKDIVLYEKADGIYEPVILKSYVN